MDNSALSLGTGKKQHAILLKGKKLGMRLILEFFGRNKIPNPLELLKGALWHFVAY